MVQLGWTSGWGDEKGIYLDSEGKLGMPTKWEFDEVALCSTKMTELEVANVNMKIKDIPGEIPFDSKLRILDSCDDERDHLLIVKQKGKLRGFSYPQNSECLDGRVVPNWLSDLVLELSQYRKRINDCK